jgi:hypothetical protein
MMDGAKCTKASAKDEKQVLHPSYIANHVDICFSRYMCFNAENVYCREI